MNDDLIQYLDNVFDVDGNTFDSSFDEYEYCLPISDQQHIQNIEWERKFINRHFVGDWTMTEAMYFLDKIRFMRDWSRE